MLTPFVFDNYPLKFFNFVYSILRLTIRCFYVEIVQAHYDWYLSLVKTYILLVFTFLILLLILPCSNFCYFANLMLYPFNFT